MAAKGNVLKILSTVILFFWGTSVFPVPSDYGYHLARAVLLSTALCVCVFVLPRTLNPTAFHGSWASGAFAPGCALATMFVSYK